MNLIHIANGFIFLTLITGVLSFFGLIFTCTSVSEKETYAGWLVVGEIIFVILFLASGFMGFATK